MTSTGQIPFKSVLKMLKKCADGFQLKPKKHLNWISYDGNTATLPMGPHGVRTNFSIEIGHVRNMVRKFGISNCAKKILPQL